MQLPEGWETLHVYVLCKHVCDSEQKGKQLQTCMCRYVLFYLLAQYWVND